MRTLSPMKKIDDIIKMFGGIRPMARALETHPSTVSSWKIRGCIPDWWHQRIVEAAQKLGFELSVADVFQSS